MVDMIRTMQNGSIKTKQKTVKAHNAKHIVGPYLFMTFIQKRVCIAIFSSSHDIPFKCVSSLFKHGLALDEHSRHAQTLRLHSQHSYPSIAFNILYLGFQP